jgi:hypothetical protein
MKLNCGTRVRSNRNCVGQTNSFQGGWLTEMAKTADKLGPVGRKAMWFPVGS